MLKKFLDIAFIFVFIVIFCSHINNLNAQSINIIVSINGAGTEKDFNILKNELTSLGHVVRHVDIHSKKGVDLNSITRADVNVFIETTDEAAFSYANKNYFIPNPEYCFSSKNTISKFDVILCRTHEVQRIFSELNPHTRYLGFTSVDRYDEKIPKNYNKYLHAIGKSPHKGTQTVFKVWGDHPEFPLLTTIARSGSGAHDPNLYNLTFLKTFLPEEKLIYLQNHHSVHICPSETEGFGHYMMEGMSAGAVVITTDAPPMNEFVKDKRCLVNYKNVNTLRLGICYQIDPISFENVIANITNLSIEELEEIGHKNREFYLESLQIFRNNLLKIFGKNN